MKTLAIVLCDEGKYDQTGRICVDKELRLCEDVAGLGASPSNEYGQFGFDPLEPKTIE
jgi:hypothetical protein